MDKDFTGWHHLKIELDARHKAPTFREREIWWCAVGMNVGYEIFGKDELFTRPVLIVRKYSKFTFFGLPLTSRRKNKTHHYPIDFQGKQGSVLLDQGRTYDSRRLMTKMGKLGTHEAQVIARMLKETL